LEKRKEKKEKNKDHFFFPPAVLCSRYQIWSIFYFWRLRMIRLQVVLDPSEAEELAHWAASELRDPRDQIRFVIRQALQQRGLVQNTDEQTDNQHDADKLKIGQEIQ
jgi:hypothetical protein